MTFKTKYEMGLYESESRNIMYQGYGQISRERSLGSLIPSDGFKNSGKLLTWKECRTLIPKELL